MCIIKRDMSKPNCKKDFLDLPSDSDLSVLTLQLFPMVILANQETIVTSHLIDQNKWIVQWKCFIQLGDVFVISNKFELPLQKIFMIKDLKRFKTYRGAPLNLI